VLKKTKSVAHTIEKMTENDLTVQRQYFFALIEKQIDLHADNEDKILLSLSLKNHEIISLKAGLSRLDDVSRKVSDIHKHHTQKPKSNHKYK
jgi:hypothetical protein